MSGAIDGIIGQVALPLPDGKVRTATLHTDRSWSFDPPFPGAVAVAEAITRDVLERISDDYGGPSDGPFGPRQLHEAAAKLGGRVTRWPDWTELPAGTIY